jgi:hypothetical protein
MNKKKPIRSAERLEQGRKLKRKFVFSKNRRD